MKKLDKIKAYKKDKDKESGKRKVKDKDKSEEAEELNLSDRILIAKSKNVSLRGYLKRKANWARTWISYYYVLEAGFLMEFKSERSKNPRKVYCLETYGIRRTDNLTGSRKSFGLFSVSVAQDPIYFRAESKQDLVKWVTGLQHFCTMTEKILWEKDAFLESLNDGVVMAGKDGIIAGVNEAFLRMFGYDRSFIIGQNVKILMEDRFAEGHNSHMARYSATGRSRFLGTARRYRVRNAQGELLPAEISLGQMLSTSDSDSRMFIGRFRFVDNLQEPEPVESSIDSSETPSEPEEGSSYGTADAGALSPTMDTALRHGFAAAEKVIRSAAQSQRAKLHHRIEELEAENENLQTQLRALRQSSAIHNRRRQQKQKQKNKPQLLVPPHGGTAAANHHLSGSAPPPSKVKKKKKKPKDFDREPSASLPAYRASTVASQKKGKPATAHLNDSSYPSSSIPPISVSVVPASSSTPPLVSPRDEGLEKGILDGRFALVDLEDARVGPRIAVSGGSGAQICSATIDGWSCVVKEFSLRDMGPYQMEMFESELATLEKLPVHPNLVRYLFHKKTAATYQLFMQRYDDNLTKVIRRKKESNHRFKMQEICSYMLQMCQGLSVLHQHEIMHRDLKSDNILVDLNVSGNVSAVVIGDFDTAKRINMQGAAVTVIGTPGYIAPEVLSGENYSFAVDIWSLGMILYELLSLQRPYEENHLQAVDFCLKGKLPTLPPDLPAVFAPLVTLHQSMLALNPVERPTLQNIIKELLSLFVLLPI